MLDRSSTSVVKSDLNKSFKTKEEVLEYLSKYLQDNIETSSRKMRNEDNFSLPSWSEFQAYQLGVIKAYTKVLDLLPTFDQKEKNV